MSMFLPPRSTKSKTVALESKVLPSQVCSKHLRIFKCAASTENTPKPTSSRRLSSRATNCPQGFSYLHRSTAFIAVPGEVGKFPGNRHLCSSAFGQLRDDPSASFLCPPVDTPPPPGPFLSIERFWVHRERRRQMKTCEGLSDTNPRPRTLQWEGK